MLSTPASFLQIAVVFPESSLICGCRYYDDPYRNLSDLQANDRCPLVFLVKHMKLDPKQVNEACERSEKEMPPKKNSYHKKTMTYKHWVQM